ncbi:hypothetical protein ACOSQ2_014599 [Xanthoceras sorbifolium]
MTFSGSEHRDHRSSNEQLNPYLTNVDVVAKERDASVKERDMLRKQIKIRSVDWYKRSPVFDGFMHQEYINGMRESRTFFKDNVAQELLKSLDKAILKNENARKKTLKRAKKLWRAYCRMMKLPLLDMHIETPPKDRKPTFFIAGKDETLIMGACSNEGLIPNFNYTLFLSDDDSEEEKEVDLTFDDKGTDDEDKSTINSLMKKGKCISLSRKEVGQSSRSIVKVQEKSFESTQLNKIVLV